MVASVALLLLEILEELLLLTGGRWAKRAARIDQEFLVVPDLDQHIRVPIVTDINEAYGHYGLGRVRSQDAGHHKLSRLCRVASREVNHHESSIEIECDEMTWVSRRVALADNGVGLVGPRRAIANIVEFVTPPGYHLADADPETECQQQADSDKEQRMETRPGASRWSSTLARSWRNGPLPGRHTFLFFLIQIEVIWDCFDSRNAGIGTDAPLPHENGTSAVGLVGVNWICSARRCEAQPGARNQERPWPGPPFSE